MVVIRETKNFSVKNGGKLRRPFEAMGFRVVGFDPYIALCDAETGNGYFQLPIYAAKKFIQLSKEREMTKEQLQLFYAILETKNSWGKNEIKTVLLEVVSGIRTKV